MSAATPPTSAPSPALPSERKKYARAVGPKLKVLLFIVFALVALLGANSLYLSSITFLQWATGETYQNYFYQLMFAGHLALGVLLIVPFVAFGVIHLVTSRNRKNRRAVRIGYALFAASIVVLLTGIGLMQLGGFDLRQPLARSVVYWLHVAAPLAAGWLYWLHRLAGPKIKWKLGLGYAGVVGVTVVRRWSWLALAGSAEVERGRARVGSASISSRRWPARPPGKFIPAETLMIDDYCLKCHADVHAGWSRACIASARSTTRRTWPASRETREVSLEARRQRAGLALVCRLPRPGAVLQRRVRRSEVRHAKPPDRPRRHHLHGLPRDHARQQHAGATPTTRSKSRCTIRSPSATTPLLQWINNQLVKAKPAFHKKTFLKPFHKTAEFCSTCHKVSLPLELNHYKEFLRGQNHYDTYLLSGVSGHGVRSFYYPPKAKTNCAECHMPLKPSDDFGAKLFDGATELERPQPPFPGGEHGHRLAAATSRTSIKAHQEFLKGVHAGRHVRRPRRGRDRRQAARRRCGRRCPTLEAGQEVPAGDGRSARSRWATPSRRGRSTRTKSGWT